MKKIFKFFDLWEDKIRHALSHWPTLYALVGILGIVLIWRGVWHLADDYNLNSWLSVALGVLILLSTGLLVAIAIGDEVLISAFHGRRKVTEIRLEEALTLGDKVGEIKKILERIENNLGLIKKEEKQIEKIEKEIIENRNG